AGGYLYGKKTGGGSIAGCSERMKRVDGLLRAIDTDTIEEYHDLQDKRKRATK
ncbi:unnamed protein product, partial [marine sediment metagenome]